MEKNPIGSSELEESTLNGLRLKVTDRCPWQCSFCHNEGGRFTADVTWGPKLENVILALMKALPGLNEVHLTGGEPTKNPALPTIVAGLVSLGLDIKMTTNGQFAKEDMDLLTESGLNSYNFSIHSLDPERFLKFQTGRGGEWINRNMVSGNELPASNIRQVKIERLDWAKRQIDRQLEMILYAKEKGVNIKVNTVISDQEGIKNARDIFNWAREHEIPLRLLVDLGAAEKSTSAIREFIETTGAEETLRKVTNGSSSCTTVYKTSDGYEFAFKQIRDIKLETMCQKCPRAKDGSCQEQFYGIRLQEGTDGKFYVLLCIQESNSETQMTVEDFINSPQLAEIVNYLK